MELRQIVRFAVRVGTLAIVVSLLGPGTWCVRAQNADAGTGPAAGVAAANPQGPALRKRDSTKEEAARSFNNPQGPTVLPSEASGEYQLGKPGDVIEIILDSNGLTGYISMLGKSDHDKEVPLTYFFDQTELNATSLSFTTKPVHGQWYSFEGTVVRGPAPTRAKEGYYLLKGRLSLHSGQGEQPRVVALPLARSENG